MLKFILSVFITLLISSPVFATSLTADEIREKIIGKKMKFETPNGFIGKLKYFTNGKSQLSDTNFNVNSDAGNWRLEGNRLCSTWTTIRNGQEKCFSYSKIGENQYISNDGIILSFDALLISY